MAQTTADVRGMKRICTGCGARFYDLNKRPINCPSCDVEFTGEIKTRGRRGRAAVANDDFVSEEEAPEAVVETEEVEAENEDVVSLEEVAEDEDDEDIEGDDIETLDDLEDDDDLDDELDVSTTKDE